MPELQIGPGRAGPAGWLGAEPQESGKTPTDLTGRARLREAALRLFASRGFEATSARAVAVEAGLSPALVMHHFGSKDGLRAAVDEWVLERIGEALRGMEAGGDLMGSLGEVTARMFGADPVMRAYLRRVLQDDSPASRALFARLLAGAEAEAARLLEREDEWVPFQMLCLVLGPLLLEPLMQPAMDEPMFDPDVLARRSAANQRLLRRGLTGKG